ncbi:MAG: FkbM family methyltransferase [Carbonactinosporaceae bacterium]
MQMVKNTGRVLSFVWTHPANRDHRVTSVTRAISFQARGRLGFRTLTTVGTSGRMWAELHYNAASKVLYANPPDWNEMQAWRRILSPGDLFVDVGSNVGCYALWAGDLGAQVIAVEPHPPAVQRLRENIALNPYDISVLECGLAAEPGRMHLTIDKESTNHLLMDTSADGQEIAVDTLDNVLGGRYAKGVKMDVEGAERLVLEGASKAMLERRIEVFQLEWNTLSEDLLGESRKPLFDVLATHGYQLMKPDGDGVLRPAGDDWGFRHTDLFAVAPGFRAR